MRKDLYLQKDAQGRPLQLLGALVLLVTAIGGHPVMQEPRYMPLHEPAVCQYLVSCDNMRSVTCERQ